ncbi:C-C chemokine receptor type 2-like [Aplochiton taeniatus]
MNTTRPSTTDNFTEDYYYNDNGDSCETVNVLTEGPVALQVLVYLVFCVGLLGNVTVIWVLQRNVKTMTDVCLLNLALSDLLLVFSLPLWAHSASVDFHGNGPCRVMTGLYQLGFYSGNLFVTMMGIDRYLAIVHAVAAARARTLRYGTLASVIVWLVSVALTAPEVIFARVEKDENDTLSKYTCERVYPGHEDTQQSWKIFRNFRENTIALFLCLPVMMFCYARILCVLQRSRNSKRGKAMNLIFIIVCLFVVCWVPYNIVIFFQTLHNIVEISCGFDAVLRSALWLTEAVALTHCCINPVIYAFVGEKFRKRVKSILAKYPLCKHLSRQAAVHSRGSENETSNTTM